MATAAQAAKHICLSVSRFRDLIGTVFERQPSGRYDLTTIREAYCLHAQKVMAGRADDGGKALSERRGRLAEAQTQAVELKTAIMSGEYVSLDAVQRIWESDLIVFRERSLSVPGKCADSLQPFTPKDRGEIEEILRSEIYDMLTDLSDPAFHASKHRTVAQDDTARPRA